MSSLCPSIMGLERYVKLLTLIFCINGAISIPSSMVDEIKTRELTPNKVKRVSLPAENPEENVKIGGHYYSNPTAIKRGAGIKSGARDNEASNDGDWTPNEQNSYQSADNDFQSTLYNEENSDGGKSIDDYEKGFQYGTNREKLDEALENAVLKSELYGYLDTEKKRRKRDSRKLNFENQVADDLTPEEVLDLLTLYENERRKTDDNLNNIEQDDALWLDVPVRPRLDYPDLSNADASYLYDQNPTGFDKPKWNDVRNKHFMIAKKRSDPTRELRYLTGPSKHDYYSLSQLLNNRRESNVPVFHRYIL